MVLIIIIEPIIEDIMKLRKKIILTISIVLVGMLVVMYAASQIILMTSFTRLEERYSLEKVKVARDTLNEDIIKLDSLVSNWAMWDDTYAFIEDANEDYIKSNLVPLTFINNRINLIIYINSSGRMVYSRAFDFDDEKEIPVSKLLQQKLSANDLLLQHRNEESSIKGIILLEDPMLIASRPILSSEKKGPVRGTLIMGRYLETKEIKRLSEIIQAPLAFVSMDSEMPSDFEAAASVLSEKTPIFTQPLSEELIAGYALLNDLYGKPSLVLRVEKPREIYKQGKITVQYLIVSLLLVGLLFGITTVMFLEESVLSRLVRLSDDVSKIGKSGNPSERVQIINGKDELFNLADDINKMLESLDASEKELRKSEAKNLALLNAIPDFMVQLRKDGTILAYKKKKGDFLLVSQDEILGKNVHKVMPAELAQHALIYVERALQTGDAQIFEFELLRNGSKRSYEARYIASGKDEALAIVRDITDRKKADETKKKELLLQEIHHRIKNNLQIISSLLYLQSKDIKDNYVFEMFKESQNRVKSMALIHEKLYQSADASRIDFGSYIRDLTSHLFQSYSTADSAVKLNINVGNLSMDIDTAIPCGFIVNELITNSLKYAFPAGKEGEISVNFYSINSKFTLIVSDDGVGLPRDLDIKNTETLGLKLVTTLVEQINGNIELDRSGGTKFKITFKELENKEV